MRYFLNNIWTVIKNNFALLLTLVVLVGILESVFYDTYARDWKSASLVEIQYKFTDGKATGFQIEDGYLKFESNDSNIIFSPATKVSRISLVCSTYSYETIKKIYYRLPGEGLSEEHSILFKGTPAVTVLQLPKIVDVAEIQLYLSSEVGDVLDCLSLTVNPQPSTVPLILRIVFYILIVGTWFILRRYLTNQDKKTKSDGITRYALVIFIALLVIVDLLYTITLSYDSGHFLSLVEEIRQGTWHNWDPIRQIGFPLVLYLAQSIFGLSTTALLIPMVLAHSILFVTGYSLIVNVFHPRSKRARLLIMGVVFIFIAMDPTVVGYFHTLLTEYLVATLAIISCLLAYCLVNTQLFSSRFYWLTASMIVLVVFAWNIKQPYIGVALFPLSIACLMLLIRSFTKKSGLYVLIVGVACAALIWGGQTAWIGFLRSQGNPLKEDRLVSNYFDKRIDKRKSLFLSDPLELVTLNFKWYLKSANAVLLDKETRQISDFSLTRSYQNKVLAHRIFTNNGGLNRLTSMYDLELDPYVYYLEEYNRPPGWLNGLFKSRLTVSNFLFTVTLLLLPFYVPLQLVYWIKRKTQVNALLLILSGTALLNALLHLFVNLIDRYMFAGYPLTLLVLVILLIQLVEVLAAKRNHKISILNNVN